MFYFVFGVCIIREVWEVLVWIIVVGGRFSLSGILGLGFRVRVGVGVRIV